MFVIFYNYNIKYIFSLSRHSKKRRKKRRRGKHLYSLFLSRKKKYSLYYQPFDSKKVYKNFASNYNSAHYSSKKNKFRIGIKSYKLKLIRIFCLKSLKFCSQRYLRSFYIEKMFKYNVSIFPDYWLTAKPKSIRMGKGKGELKFKVFFLKRGTQIYNFKFLRNYFNFLINKKLFIIKLSIFSNLLLKILKGKPSLKCLFYKYFF